MSVKRHRLLRDELPATLNAFGEPVVGQGYNNTTERDVDQAG